ncbi:class I SAM-dependent methyltransferase [Paenibacillus sp. MBLB4367]|uniref:class I SAM-dependent methyltransferase n=1 Tax=Paenibacillus sp. MBLB4367 TaxID=3384767 RepID=UPI003907F18D
MSGKVVEYYSRFGENEWLRLERQPLEFIVNWHYIRKHLPAAGKLLDNGAGPGKYAMELAKSGYIVTLTDLTPGFVELARTKAEQYGIADRFDGFHAMDARHLAGLPDDHFDAALMMGPLYHLQEEEDRRKALSELRRVTKPGGTVFIAVRTRQHWTLNTLLQPEHWPPFNSIDPIIAFQQTGCFDHSDEGRYTGAYFFESGRIVPYMEESGFETVTLVGSTNLGCMLNDEQKAYWQEKGEYEKLIGLLIDMAEDPSISGMSSHSLYIGKKK